MQLYIENPDDEKQKGHLSLFFSSLRRHLKVLLIAAFFSTIVYGGMYIVMMLTGRV